MMPQQQIQPNPDSMGFNAIRLLAAIMVIVHHSISLLQLPSFFPDLGNTAVSVFMVISGYLLTHSWASSPGIVMFMWKRYLRLFPALAGCILSVAVLLGPALTALSPASYFGDPLFIKYLRNIFLFNQADGLPGVFESNPLSFVNGSLWFLPYQFFIIAVYALHQALSGKRTPHAVVAGIFCTFVASDMLLRFLDPGRTVSFLGMHADLFARLGAFFYGGSLCRLYGRRLPFTTAWAVPALVVLLVSYHFNVPALHYVVLPYLVTFTAAKNWDPLIPPLMRNDISYGMYLYGFPVQQTLIAFGGAGMNVFVHIALSVLLTLCPAVLSWRFIERPCLRLKYGGASSTSRNPDDPPVALNSQRGVK